MSMTVEIVKGALGPISLAADAKEYFQAPKPATPATPAAPAAQPAQAPSKLSTIRQIVNLLLGVAAFYLSWSCNTKEDMVVRVLYAFVAFLFAPIYLIYYLIARRKECADSFKSITTVSGF